MSLAIAPRFFLPLCLCLTLAVPGAMAQRSAAQYRQEGLRYRSQGQFAEAIAAFKTAVELEPDNLAGRVTLGWTLHLAGQAQAAATALQETLSQDPTYVPALNALGIVYLVNDDPVAAILAHTWAKTLTPDNEIAYYNLSLAFHRLQYYKWAIAAAQKAAILEPTNPHPLVALAIAQWDQGNTAIAQQTYQQAMNLDGRYRSAAFLDHLSQAGFSADQINVSQDVLKASRSN